MKCPEVVEWMHRYLDYDLSEEETVQLYEHLKHCPECTETFRMLKSLSRDLEDLPKVTPKFSIVDAIMPQLEAIDQARQEKALPRRGACRDGTGTRASGAQKQIPQFDRRTYGHGGRSRGDHFGSGDL
ncbi:zf-HC2 domain-containing protein [Paenibacillus sp. JTLBN-2024]